MTDRAGGTGTAPGEKVDGGSDGAGAAEGGDAPGGVDPGMLSEVMEGLNRPARELSPKYFYDHEGSELFEAITRLPEYYLTRTEEALMADPVPSWIHDLRPATLVELGAGSARKTRALLDAMRNVGSGRLFVPVDVSGDFLRNTVTQVRREYPDLSVEPVVGDITRPLDLGGALHDPTLFVLLGSTIGNFPETAGVALLRSVREIMGEGDRFLMGADLRPGQGKSVQELEAAYNDRAGVTAAFNLNVLKVLNRDLGADFDPSRFRHRAFYDAGHGRIEMHLVSLLPQTVTFAGGAAVTLEEGESIRTEISCKYDRPTLEGLLGAAGMEVDRWAQDADGRFAVCLARVSPP